MGQRKRDIWSRGRHVKVFGLAWPLSGVTRHCHATFHRICKEFNHLSDNISVTRDDVLAAAERIAGQVERTPLIEARILGHAAWLKCESMQTGGAFKLRGATNRLVQLSAAERARAAWWHSRRAITRSASRVRPGGSGLPQRW